jgi:hypothetical protein
MLGFLTDLYEKHMSYSSINSARSALSAMGIVRDSVSGVSHPKVKRFMKGIYNLRPPVSRHKSFQPATNRTSWDGTIRFHTTYK